MIILEKQFNATSAFFIGSFMEPYWLAGYEGLYHWGHSLNLFFLCFRMNSTHGCVLIGEDWLPWQMLVLMIMAASFFLHWVEQMNLTISTPSLERFVSIMLGFCDTYDKLNLWTAFINYSWDIYFQKWWIIFLL